MLAFESNSLYQVHTSQIHGLTTRDIIFWAMRVSAHPNTNTHAFCSCRNPAHDIMGLSGTDQQKLIDFSKAVLSSFPMNPPDPTDTFQPCVFVYRRLNLKVFAVAVGHLFQRFPMHFICARKVSVTEIRCCFHRSRSQPIKPEEFWRYAWSRFLPSLLVRLERERMFFVFMSKLTKKRCHRD